MFTGIIEAKAKVRAVGAGVLTLERPKHFHDVKHGSSIAVSGACLSVTSLKEDEMSFDVVRTTMKKTKLGDLKVGDFVNLERAMPANGRFEGHVVTGHIEGVGIVANVTADGISVTIPTTLLPYVVPHGSITIDGVSLTVAHIQDDRVTTALIPVTRAETTLGVLRTGDRVNLETDILGRYILKSHEQR